MSNSVPLFARLTIPLTILLLSAAAGWASFTEIDEITRGEGKVIPATKTQSIQATEAGVVKQIEVRLGQVVREGDLIVRLDDTSTSASLGETVARHRALQARIARLSLEEVGAFDSPYACPESLLAVAPQICENEARLFKARRENFLNRIEVLKQREAQRRAELTEVNSNIERLKSNLEISTRELELIRPMAKRRLIAKTELIRVERDVSESGGQLKLAQESVERINGAIQEASLQVKEISLQMQQEALDQKTQALSELSVLDESARGAANRVARTDIRSPVDGVVNSLSVNTIGSFVQPGSLIAEVVPTSAELLVEVRISPRDVAFIRVGQPALVKVSAYDFSIYGGLDALVSTVTADSVVDQQTGEPFFQVLVRTNRAYLEHNGRKFKITPGMIGSADIITGRKSILHYLLKPINKARQEALTER
ncbi:MAG: HlyD family type I secretion periplasmic adaptor subunit [Rhizobiaceae bacterium]